MNDATSHSDGLSPAAVPPAPYRVLARKYRPMTFKDLIGQEPMVRTLTNAFQIGRIAQGYMLTGVRGVGKTTTARIIARALNYSLPGKIDQPTVEMDGLGEHCAAIMESRHVDVSEMDAASHTGIGDIREIIESVRYKPVSARYKVYIIDEVHMLSNQAFNGLLKTLEEPPEHVKFIFATTEIRKVPITILSRCQRFDLRRIDAGELVGLMRAILTKENVEAEDDALALVARAAEGSARDALSILDQAIAHSGGIIRAEHVRDMLGLADRSRVIDLFRAVMRGEVAGALDELRAQYDAGADPVVILSDLANFVHLVTRFKYVPSAAADASLADVERREAASFAEGLDMRVLARAWQMLLKGIQETQGATRPLAAAEMVLVRLAHAAGLPTPDELIRALKPDAGAPSPAVPQGSGGNDGPSLRAVAAPVAGRGNGQAQALSQTSVQPAATQDLAPAPVTLASFDDLVALAAEKRDLPLKLALSEQVRLVRFEPGRIEIALTPDAPRSFANDLSNRLKDWTGVRWMVIVSAEKGAPTIADRAAQARAQLLREAAADPGVKRLLDQFPGAEIVDVRDIVNDPMTGDGLVPPGDADDDFSDFSDMDELD